jgi:hypothetical protein
MLEAIQTHLPPLRPAQQRGLALWVYGTLLAHSGCQSAVLRALGPIFGRGAQHALRQMLREWCLDGADKTLAGRHQVEVTACFAPLLGWVLTWWQGQALALAVDATTLGDRLVILSVSVLYRGSAIPVAWHVLRGQQPGPWLEPILALLTHLGPAVPETMTVLVLADRGLWSPKLWQAIRILGWHPLLRLRPDVTFRPTGGQRVRADTLVPGPGHAWIGTGVAFKHRTVRRAGTLVVVWEEAAREPWLCLTDLPPDHVGPAWYGLRVWVELGFRTLKSVGWQWQRTRRTAPERVGRHWLVLAIATLWTVAVGTRVEDAERWGREPAGVRIVLPPPPGPFRRTVSVFQHGLPWLHWQLLRQRRLWRLLWLRPEPWPDPPAALTIVVVPP